jgi:L-aminopeptidase/D-esterase-like protein
VTARTPSLTDIGGLAVGHWTNAAAATGCTVVLGPPDGMAAAASLRGRATGTREIDALSPRHLVSRIDALLLTGGSAYGLGAADGVMRWLAERGRGITVRETVVPIVPTAVIFDLGVGESAWPEPSAGYAACVAAGTVVTEGSVGAGTGATVGKALGLRGAMKGGVGTWSVRSSRLVVGALVVTNAFGDVRDGDGQIIAGARRDGAFADARAVLTAAPESMAPVGQVGESTTLAVIATNARLGQLELAEVATMAADGLAARITPFGTRYDGDIVFAVATGEVEAVRPEAVELLAQDVVARAVERSVRLARGVAGIPGLADSGDAA